MNTRRNSMVRLWRQGYTIPEIAAEFGTTALAVMRMLAACGIKYYEEDKTNEEVTR